MIDIIYNKNDNITRVELQNSDIFFNYELPLTVEFKNYVNNEVAWSSNLYKGHWTEWTGGEAKYNLTIKNSQGRQILEWRFNVEDNGSQAEKMLYYSIKNNSIRSKGMIIGSHDGTFGGWVFPVMEDSCDIVMADGGLEQLSKAKINYSHLTNCKFINDVITPNGEDITWYEGGEGFTDTVDKSVILKFLKDDEIKSQVRTSISINELFEKNGKNFDWLYLDTEGIDVDLILSLKYFPDLIFFEPDHTSNSKFIELDAWLKLNNYTLFKELDYVAIKNKN
jgi:hypothetical protein